MTKPRQSHKDRAEGSQVLGIASSPSDYAFNVNFNNGTANLNNQNNQGRVLAVRSVVAAAGECQGVTGEASFRDLYRAFQKARRHKVPSQNQLQFEANWIDGLLDLQEQINAQRWKPRPTTCFIAVKPKARQIHAPDFADRVVHHWLVPQLEAIYERTFIHHSYANRRGKGTHAAVDALRQQIREVHSGQGGGWYLQLDIRNFFNSIHRPTLYRMLKTRMERCGVPEITQRVAHALLCHSVERQRVRDGVTEEMVTAALDGLFDTSDYDFGRDGYIGRDAVRSMLVAVAHLLSKSEAKADENAVPVAKVTIAAQMDGVNSCHFRLTDYTIPLGDHALYLHPPAQVPADLADFVRGMHTLELYNASTNEPYFDCNGSDMWCSTEDFAGKDGEKFVRFLFGCSEFVKAKLNDAPVAEPVAQPDASPSIAVCGTIHYGEEWYRHIRVNGASLFAPLDNQAGVLHALKTLAAQPRAVPDGWALVPREPTKEMIEQGASSLQVDVDFTRRPQLPTRQRAARNAYVSMLITAAKQADR